MRHAEFHQGKRDVADAANVGAMSLSSPLRINNLAFNARCVERKRPGKMKCLIKAALSLYVGGMCAGRVGIRIKCKVRRGNVRATMNNEKQKRKREEEDREKLRRRYQPLVRVVIQRRDSDYRRPRSSMRTCLHVKAIFISRNKTGSRRLSSCKPLWLERYGVSS